MNDREARARELGDGRSKRDDVKVIEVDSQPAQRDATRQPAVEVRKVTKAFPGQLALNDVSFTINQGSIHALLGQNGSGKSTLIRVLSGYYVPQAGTVRVAGEPLDLGSPGASATAGLRFVHQDLALIEEMNAVENMGLTAGYSRARDRGINWRTEAARTRRLLGKLNLTVDIWRPLARLPAIERTAVAIARAMDGLDENSGTLVLDEPTAALAPPEAARLFSVLRDLQDAGATILYVTHRLDEVFDLADDVSILRDGICVGTYEKASLTHRRLVRLIVGDDPRRSPERASRASRDQPKPRLAVRGIRTEHLANVDLDVAAGEIVGVAGVVGSGRDELPYAIAGAVERSSGRVMVDGAVLSEPGTGAAKRAGIGLVPGNRRRGSAVEEFLVRENLTLPSLYRQSLLRPIRKQEEIARVREWLERLEVRPADPSWPYAHLSGGNKQKVIVGKWLETRPSVLLFDEPTAGVDVGAKEAIYEVIRRQAQDGLAVLLCSSDLEDFEHVCSRVLVFRRGHVAGQLSGTEISHEAILELMVPDQSRDARDTAPSPTAGDPGRPPS